MGYGQTPLLTVDVWEHVSVPGSACHVCWPVVLKHAWLSITMHGCSGW